MSQSQVLSTAARPSLPARVTPAVSVANYSSPAARLTRMIQGILDGQSLHDDTSARIERVLANAAKQGLVVDAIPFVYHCQQDFGCWVQQVQATLLIGGVRHPVEWTIDPERHERLMRYGPEVMRGAAKMKPRIVVH